MTTFSVFPTKHRNLYDILSFSPPPRCEPAVYTFTPDTVFGIDRLPWIYSYTFGVQSAQMGNQWLVAISISQYLFMSLSIDPNV